MSEIQENLPAELIMLIESFKPGPPDNRLWDAEDIANYFKTTKKTVQNKYLKHRNFPRPTRPCGNGFPVYEPKEVKQWGRTFKDKKAA